MTDEVLELKNKIKELEEKINSIKNTPNYITSYEIRENYDNVIKNNCVFTKDSKLIMQDEITEKFYKIYVDTGYIMLREVKECDE